MSDRDVEITGFAADTKDLRIDHQVDIEMPSGFDKLWADGAHGAVVRGKGLIELGHMSADGGFAIHEVDAETLVSQVETGLHSGNAAAHDHDSPDGLAIPGDVCSAEGVCLRTVFGHGTPLPWLGASFEKKTSQQRLDVSVL